jgi:hypothetical protein
MAQADDILSYFQRSFAKAVYLSPRRTASIYSKPCTWRTERTSSTGTSGAVPITMSSSVKQLDRMCDFSSASLTNPPRDKKNVYGFTSWKIRLARNPRST